MSPRNPLERLIGAISPRAALEREAARQLLADMQGQRSYAGAERGRKTADWRASAASGNAEALFDLTTLRNRSRQLVRDNGYVAAALRHLTANIVGTGIELRAIHDDAEVAKRAKGLFDAWALEPVDVEERHDFYGVQKLAVRSMIEGGETLIGWAPDRGEPNAKILLMEGDQIDASRHTALENGGRVVAGVEYDKAGRRVAYHLWDKHPGDALLLNGIASSRHDAADFDHMFEALRISGQARGVPWFHPALVDVREVEGIEQSLRIKRRVEACLAVFRKAGEGGQGSPLGQKTAQDAGPAWETLSPGMVINGRPGEEIQVINPSAAGDGDGFMRFQLMKISAAFGLPYSVMTGDVSQANYSSQRAAMVAFWALLDDWVYNTVVPQLCNRAFRRRMAVEALKTGDRRLLEVRGEWTPPRRQWVDPLKDITAEILDVRAFPGGLPQAMASRGRDYREALYEQASVDALITELGIALDSDARRTTQLGVLQAAAGYVRPAGDQTAP